MNPADLFAHEENPVRLAAGETLFKAGEPGDCMFVLLEGALSVNVADKVVEHSVRGAILGEMALFDHSPRAATVIAREVSALAKIDERRFHYLISQNPFFAMHVMKLLADRIRQMNHMLTEQKSPAVYNSQSSTANRLSA